MAESNNRTIAQQFKSPDLASGRCRGVMNQDREFAAMADSCIAAQVAIERSGTPEMKTLIRILLFQIGQELGRRELGRRELARREAERPKTSR